MATRSFQPALFSFLRDLGDNNDRDWFAANKQRYEHDVKEPALDFIDDFRPHLERFSPHFEANARAVGGSLFRIHRDTRFSKDKTPYKTNTGMHFRHEMAKDAHAPGIYVHLEPRNCFFGIGLWRPEPKVAQQIRHHIADHREHWTAIVSDPAFTSQLALSGDRLVRPPRGFDADDPLIDDLKRKDFIATTSLRQSEVTASGFLDRVDELATAGRPLAGFLCEAVGVPF